MLIFFLNLSFKEFKATYLSSFRLFSVIDGFECLRMRHLQKNIQLMLEFLKAPTLFQLYINNLPDDVICNIAIYADDTTLYYKYFQASDMW